MANQDLRGYAGGADFIILTSEEFQSVADRIKTFREQPANGGLKTIVVDVATIYNEFGGGLPDITAIRDYLKYAYDTWTPRPTFVLFLGGASYDYKSDPRHQIQLCPDLAVRRNHGMRSTATRRTISSPSSAQGNAAVAGPRTHLRAHGA